MFNYREALMFLLEVSANFSNVPQEIFSKQVLESFEKKNQNLLCVTFKNGQTYFKNLAGFAARILNCVTIFGRYALKANIFNVDIFQNKLL